MMNSRPTKRCQWLAVFLALIGGTALAADLSTADRPILVKAVMCESIQNYEPVNSAVVFSIELGRVSCYTKFDPVPKQTFIFHKWYHADDLITVKRLTINPPAWASFTSVQLRDADKGPWRVVITDAEDNPMQTLRFSITD